MEGEVKRRWLFALLAVAALGCDHPNHPFVDMERGFCKQNWQVVHFEVRGDTAFVTSICR